MATGQRKKISEAIARLKASPKSKAAQERYLAKGKGLESKVKFFADQIEWLEANIEPSYGLTEWDQE